MAMGGHTRSAFLTGTVGAAPDITVVHRRRGMVLLGGDTVDLVADAGKVTDCVFGSGHGGTHARKFPIG